jgi:hypothetical protein
VSNGKAIPVWYTEEDRPRLETAAAIAGYKHISKYIRDKSLNRESERDNIERQEMLGTIFEMERTLKSTNAILAIMVGLLKRRASSGEITDLRAELIHKSVSPEDMVTELLPEFSKIISQL